MQFFNGADPALIWSLNVSHIFLYHSFPCWARCKFPTMCPPNGFMGPFEFTKQSHRVDSTGSGGNKNESGWDLIIERAVQHLFSLTARVWHGNLLWMSCFSSYMGGRWSVNSPVSIVNDKKFFRYVVSIPYFDAVLFETVDQWMINLQSNTIV